MRQIIASSLFLFLLGGTVFISGCASSQPSPDLGTSRTPSVRDEQRREYAMRSFIRGATLDAKGAHAEAILEYQEALLQSPSAAIYHAISRDFSRLGKHARAAETAREAVRLDPNNVAYRENLAYVYLNALQTDLATKEFEAIIRLDSNSVSAWYNLARLSQQTRPIRALEIYERILERQGENLDVLFQCAALASMLGRHDDAVTYLRRMTDLDPANRVLQRQLAESYLKAGKQEEARTILERLLELDRNDPETIAALAELLLDQRAYGRATELFEQLLAQGLTSPEVKLRIGVGFFAQSETDTAMAARSRTVLEEVRTELPNDWRAYWYLGLLASHRREDSTATSCFTRVTQLAPWNGDAWWLLGSGYFDRGEYAKVFETMEQARKALPEDARVYLLLGLASSRTGDTTKALEHLERSYKLDPRDLNTLSTLALTYEGLKRYEDCDRIYEEALKLEPNSALLLNNYGYSLADRGVQLDRALEMATKAVDQEPENPSYLDTLGWVYFRLGRYPEAAIYIERAVKGEASAVIHEHLGDVYSKLGKPELAQKHWNLGLEKDPNNASLRAKVERGTL